MADAPEPHPEGCDVVAVSSRACERGTRGCETRHLLGGPELGAPMGWLVLPFGAAAYWEPSDHGAEAARSEGATLIPLTVGPAPRWTPLAEAPAEWVGRRVWMLRKHWMLPEVGTMPPVAGLAPDGLAGTWVAPLSYPSLATVPERPGDVPPEE